MLIAVCAAVLFAAAEPPPTPAIALSIEQTSAKEKKQKAEKAGKKVKKKKAATDEEVAPDEPVDPEADAPSGGAWTFSWKQHPSLRYGNLFRLDVEGKMQEDGHSAYGVVKGLDTWEFHRNRFGIKGYVTKHIEYEVEHEFTEKELTEKDLLIGITPSSKWKDVYVNLTYQKSAQVQIGKFKVPFGLDELTGVTHNDFIYRSLGAVYLAPARDIGAQVHGSIWKHGFSYAAGVFQHDGDNARSKKIQGGDATFAARVTADVFRKMTASPLGQAEVGFSYAVSALSDDSFQPNGLRGRTVMTQDDFYANVFVKGHRRRWGADIDWSVGPGSLRAEYTSVSDDRLGQGIRGEDLPDARARSWYVSGTWVLTGEDKKRPLKPAQPFVQAGIGAIEVAARFERLGFDSPAGTEPPFRNSRAETILPSADRALTLGVNWTLNRFVKLQFNGIREQLSDPQRNPVPNGAAFWSRVIRLQFVL